MEAIGQTDQQYSNIGSHGQQHFANVFSLIGQATVEFNGGNAGGPGDDIGDIFAEFTSQLGLTDRLFLLFEDSVEHPGNESGDI